MERADSTEYYAAREACERALAAGARDMAVAAVHLDMAERYALLQWPRGSVHERGAIEHSHAEG